MAAISSNQEVKLTHSPISKSLWRIINRLQDGHPVPIDCVMNTPEVKLGEQVLAQCPSSTMRLDPRPRQIMRNGIKRKLMNMGSAVERIDDNGKPVTTYDGPVACGKQVHFVIGLPASGKSSALADKISQEFSAKVLDNDVPKEMIPEFWDGWGSGAVHEEAKMLTDEVMGRSIALGENLVIPKIGEPPESVMHMMEQFKEAGYSVNVHYMDIDANKALGRLLARFVTTGRYIGPEWLYKFTGEGKELMRNSYETMKNAVYTDKDGNQTKLVDGYSEWTNEVAYGEAPILVDYGGTCKGRFIDAARTDIENKDKIADESKFVEDASVSRIRSDVLDEEMASRREMMNTEEAAMKIAAEAKLKELDELSKYREMQAAQERDSNLDGETIQADDNHTSVESSVKTQEVLDAKNRIHGEKPERIKGDGSRPTLDVGSNEPDDDKEFE